MGQAKQIKIKVIPAGLANDFVRRWHYSGSIVQNSVLHFGAFLHGGLHGVLSYGNPIDKRNVMGFVRGTGWNDFLELNRLAFDPELPKNSESRAIAISCKLLRKNAPHVKWILSFADATQCGDGTIYRASGFILCGIKKNSTIHRLPSGKVVAKHGTSRVDFTGSKKLEGYQIRYIKFLDSEKEKDLTLKRLPYSEIQRVGAGMYKGKTR